MQSGRRYDIDWLRVGATLLLFPFHVGKTFDTAPFFHIKNAQLSPGLSDFTGFISLFHMPLFFLLAGWSLAESLRKRSAAGVLAERRRRLLIPFLVGVALMGPIMKYIELKTVGPSGFDETFIQFLPHFFTRLSDFTWGHLWFLIYLFVFTVLYMPLFSAAMRWPGRVESVPGWAVYLPILPLALIQIALRPYWPGMQNLYNDWANFAYYSAYLALGFALARFPAIEQAFHRQQKVAALLAIAALVPIAGPNLWPPLEWFLDTAAGFCIIVFLLGWANARANKPSKALGYLAEAAFPVYIIHQTVIIVIGYYLIRLGWGIAPKFVALLVASVVTTFGIYHFCVRPWGVARELCGMRPARQGPSVAA